MKLSTRSRYGLRAMLELSRSHSSQAIPLHTLAKRQDLSPKYLEQLLIPLKGAGFVKSARGARGGYALAVDPAELSIYQIVKELEGPLSLLDCVEDPDLCPRRPACATHVLWRDMTEIIINYLSSRTLADLLGAQMRMEGPTDAEG